MRARNSWEENDQSRGALDNHPAHGAAIQRSGTMTIRGGIENRKRIAQSRGVWTGERPDVDR